MNYYSATRLLLMLAVLLPASSGTVLAGPGGPDRAQKEVLEGTATGSNVLKGVEGEVPEEARPAIRRSYEESQTGGREALDAIERERAYGRDSRSGRGGSPAGGGRGGPR